MHYYQFHIGDYKAHTHHLSLMEDLAFRRLLDFYYLHEGPIKTHDIARQIGMREHEQDVLTVLNEFFMSTPNGFINARADKEIENYRSMSEGGKRGAAKRWSKGRDSPPIEPLIATNNHKPITNNHIVKQTRGSRLSTDFVMPDDWSAFCKQDRPDLNARQVFEQFKDYWIAQPGQKGVKMDWDATWRNWVRRQNAPKISSADIARVTVPGSQERDPALVKLDQDSKIVAPPPADILAKLQQLKKVAP